MRRFEASPHRATPKGHKTFIFHAAPRPTRHLPTSQPRLQRSWHTDITYIQTGEGWVYLATVIDCYSKMVVGWSMADHYKISLICSALDSAAGAIDLRPGCVFHSDRGSNYTSYDFAKKIKGLNMRQSVGRTGICWDNAMAESFFAALKNEWIHRMTFTTRSEARQAIVQYIEGFYNRQRLHSGLGYKTPLEVHNEYLNGQLAA